MTRRLSESECESIYRDLEAYVREHLARGNNKNLALDPWERASLGGTHLCVGVNKLNEVDMRKWNDLLDRFIPKTTLFAETKEDLRVAYEIQVPIRVPKYNSTHKKHARSYTQSSSTPKEWALIYLLVLLGCVAVVWLKLS